MKVYFLCVANETTVEILRGYAKPDLAQRALGGFPDNRGLTYGVLELDMRTRGEDIVGVAGPIPDDQVGAGVPA